MAGPAPAIGDLIALYSAGRLGEAEAACRAFLTDHPQSEVVHNILGAVLMGSGRAEEAVAAIRQALTCKPDYAQGHNNLGNALRQTGREAAAAEAFAEAARLMPDLVEAHGNLGTSLAALGRRDEAVTAFQAALARDPNYVEAHHNLGAVLYDLGRFEEAETCSRAALALQPGLAAAHVNLGNVLLETFRAEAAVAAYDQALDLAPGAAEAHYNRGKAWQALGDMEKAIADYRAAIQADPTHRWASSNLLMALNYSEHADPDSVFAAHRDVAKALYSDAAGGVSPPSNLPPSRGEALNQPRLPPSPSNGGGLTSPSPLRGEGRGGGERHRPLKIGYVSPDFRTHSVAYFFEPVLRAHDRSRVHVTCYSTGPERDRTTARLEALADRWRDISTLSDAEAKALVQEDGIDVLIDLAGHSRRNRLGLFALRAAPVQVTWLGYPNTTGLIGMNYRLTDAVADPVGAPVGAEAFHTETLIHLPGGFLCYGGDPDAPILPGPAPAAGHVTFGSFNNSSKITVSVIETWAEILKSVPNSRLILKAKQFADNSVRRRYRHLFEAQGIDAARLEMLGRLPGRADHLALYGRIDIALDPFPYTGATTTCEALWMGVPVVTLRGDRHAARVGASLLTRIGEETLIAETREDYVGKAVALAGNAEALAAYRHDLRVKMTRSPLCDAKTFARNLEGALA